MASALEGIRDQTKDVLRSVIGPVGTEVALLDYPRYQNAGDALIWLGQLHYLRTLGCRVRYQASQFGFDARQLRKLHPSGPLLITGGGNLGDRWLPHQEMREAVVATFPDRRIIQLPQSINFSNEARRDAARSVFEAHPDLTLLMRDQVSLAAARAAFPGVKTRFCPDAAYGVGPLSRVGRPDVDIMLLLRNDTEAVPRILPTMEGVTVARADWRFPPGYGTLLWKMMLVPEALTRGLGTLGASVYGIVSANAGAMARANVFFARRVLGRGRVVITDRLHAMVLASLSGIPVIALDNSYGKVSAIYREYGHELSGTRFAASMDEAVELARQLLDQ
ncbi:polysaccharide pyruvyl transferase family protein [Blastococcus sp. PRF04-17]|uniref:polysaccharide pyruvyl transferase family protein n=1 Tax=Blastococcus sp. PRF04-17 TaxID=2933797 RepID=UPI001FF16701|nr:polysaccharide pyruvyl transferase family protein [Blastococcus sp. PRF04-17]UOY00223.1 polysaccharide pyruvyl transferase family protein [Blastococcus sp. PRF04-17]